MLVNCVAYEDGRKLADVPAAEVHDYIKRPGIFVWMALRDTEDAELARAVLADAPFPHHEGQSEDEAWTLHYVEDGCRREAIEWLEDLARTWAGEIRPPSAAQFPSPNCQCKAAPVSLYRD